MKLRNKKTGDIVDYTSFEAGGGQISMYVFDTNKHYYYSSLSELNEDWEDYEEDNYYYAITSIKADDGITKTKNKHNDMTAFDKSIGNYFATEEEAEEAVEKLKAWKRLKDKGLTFCAWKITDDGCSVDVETTLDAEIIRAQQKYITDDLNLLFGGEE